MRASLVRRVATLVAHEAPPARVFAAVAEEAGRLLQADAGQMYRFEPDGSATVVASWATRGGGTPAPGTFVAVEPGSVPGRVLRTSQPARTEDTGARRSSPYFVIAEGRTNVAKRAQASRAEVVARVRDDCLCVEVRDDGVGNARPDGSGLVGLADRVAVLDGRLRVASPAGGGTVVEVAVPIG